ncbi:filamentous hemagglutinin family N-terminal domain protein [Leptolyngbyaceae cyanobacterium JSC-12]|nr:filamentous hemagglutinin family N-terminal domain protein [Leptolyngbyaceae cyanobacterium JSC-12]
MPDMWGREFAYRESVKLPYRSSVFTQGMGWLGWAATIWGLSISSAHAQIIPDRTLPNPSSVIPGCTTCVIEGGTERGVNLYHSFREFSVPTGGEAWFNNAAHIQTILTRVTGNSISTIDGLIRANGTANLFLINPNGMLFGVNARLQLGGSFSASSASSIRFFDGSEFSAIAPQPPPLLTVNLAPGLQYGTPRGDIRNQASLAVLPLQSLTFYGNNVTSTGSLVAPGGMVQVLGDRVSLLDQARIDVSGIAGGGTALIGGAYQGEGTLPTAHVTEVGQAVVIQADALSNGNGGSVIVWADDTTRFHGTITAKGAEIGGNGGLVETSGKVHLTVGTAARVDVSAVQGSSGTWLLDPTSITVVAAGGIDPSVAAANANPGASTIDFTVINTALNTGNVTLTASNLITINPGTTLTIPASTTLALNAPTVNLNAAITTAAPTSLLTGAATTANLTPGANLQNGVDVALPGAIVNLAPGTYTQTQTVAIAKSLTLAGSGAANTTISGNDTVRVFNINAPNVVLDGLTIANGNVVGSGGGILHTGSGTLTITNSVLANHRATSATGEAAPFVGSPVSSPNPGVGGTTNGFGGAIYSQGILNISNSTFSGNSAQGGNGGSNVSFGSGGAGAGAGMGGAIFNEGGTVTISNSTFLTNQANGGNGGFGGPGFGGAGSGGGGIGGTGGAPGNNDSPGSFGGGGGGGGSFGGNGSTGGFGGGGGGAASGGTIGGFGGFGGGNGGAYGVVSAGIGGGGGGGAAGLGGAIFSNGGIVNILNSTFSANQVRGGDGGGTPADGSAQGGDGGSGNGGAVFGFNASVGLTNSTIANNQAIGGIGGIIYNGTTGALVGRNGEGRAGGISGNGGQITLSNSIVAGNTAAIDPDVSGGIASQGFNLVQIRGSSTGFISSDLPDGTNPLLGPLQNNGGLTQTHALLEGSPAINAGGRNATSRDQRGRLAVGIRDIGAFEFGAMDDPLPPPPSLPPLPSLLPLLPSPPPPFPPELDDFVKRIVRNATGTAQSGTQPIPAYLVSFLRSTNQDPFRVIAIGCNSTQQRFVVTGRGGVAASPTDVFGDDRSLVQLMEPVPTAAQPSSRKAIAPSRNLLPPNEIVEVRGWVTGQDGALYLVADSPAISNRPPIFPSLSCEAQAMP